MPKYQVKVTCTYPVEALNARDALSTVPMVIHIRFFGGHAKGITEIFDASTGALVLKAELNPDIKKEAKS